MTSYRSAFVERRIQPYNSARLLNVMSAVTNSPSRVSAPYIAPIDSLRAIAVLAVMAYHLHPRYLPGGFAGVDVFLVISGYVISRSMLALDARNLFVFATGFYARRARRILPALLPCLLVTSILVVLFVPNSWLSRTTYGTAVYAVWGFSNYYLSHFGDQYFDPRAEFNAFTHTWSLGVEEQFYWLYPFLFYVWLRTRVRVPWLGPMLLLSALAVSFVYCARSPATTAYYSLPSRFWELACGGLLYQTQATGWRVSGFPGAQFAMGMVAVILGLIFSRGNAFPFPWALPATIGSALIISSVTQERIPSVARWMNSRVLVWIGKRSYSLYLWHWPVYVLFRWTVGLDYWLERGLALGLILALSDLSFRWIETPFRRGFRALYPSAVVACGVAAMFVGWQTIRILDAHRQRISLSVTRDFERWYPRWDAADARSDPTCPTTRSHEVFGGGSLLKAVHNGCARRTLFVSGNSHALAYITLLAGVADSRQTDVRIYFLEDCALFGLKHPESLDRPKCWSFYRMVKEDIATRARVGDVLFLPSLRLERFVDQSARFPEGQVRAKMTNQDEQRLRSLAVADAVPTLKALTDRGVRVIFEAPKPIFRAPPFRCSDWFNRMNPICSAGFAMSRADLITYRQPVMQQLAQLQRLVPVEIWDPFDALCPGEPCRAVENGVPLFLDGDHLSGAGNQRLSTSFLSALR